MLMKLPSQLLEKEAELDLIQKKLLAANKAAARLLLLGIMSDSRSSNKSNHSYEEEK